MPLVVFEWTDGDGVNQQVCQTDAEILEFVKMNPGSTVTIDVW